MGLQAQSINAFDVGDTDRSGRECCKLYPKQDGLRKQAHLILLHFRNLVQCRRDSGLIGLGVRIAIDGWRSE